MKLRKIMLPVLGLSLSIFVFANTAFSQTAMDYYKLGNKAKKEYRYNDAIKYYNLAGNLLKEFGRKGDYAIMLYNIGRVYEAWGQYDKAIEYYRKALTIFEEQEQKGSKATLLNNIGLVYEAWGQYDKSIEYFRKALIINEELGKKSGIAIDLNNIGTVYDSWGQYDKAIEYYSKALIIDEELGKKGDIAIDLNNIGEVYRAWGQYDKAIKNYRKALTIFEELEQKGSIATLLNNIGEVYRAWGQHDKAIKNYRKALTIDEELGKKGDIAIDLNNIGMVYNSWGQYNKAVEYYKKALTIDEELGKKSDIARDLNNIGIVYKAWGQYDKAIEYYSKALTIDEELGRKGDIAIRLNNIGGVYNSWGQYDKAIEYYRKALTISEELEQKVGIAILLNNIGEVYRAWGQYDKAIEYYRKALTIFEELEQKGSIATLLNNIGLVYEAWGQYDKAIEYFRKALTIDEELGKKGNIAIDLNNIGGVYDSWSQYDKAIEYYSKALTIDEELGKKSGIAIDLNNIGIVYKAWGQYDKAIEYYRKALTIDEELGKKSNIAIDLNNIGTVYYSWGQYDKAIENYNKSIVIKEQLRLTAKGTVRRDYLASQIVTYQFLTSTYIRDKKPDLAFNTTELSSAKYLAEQLAEKNNIELQIIDIDKYKNNLPAQTAVIKFANMDKKISAIIAVDNNNIYATEVSNSTLISEVSSKYSKSVNAVYNGLRGFKVISENKKEIDSAQIEGVEQLNKIINYYRTLLKNPDSDKETFEYVSRCLYKFLFHDIEEDISDKKELIILPDGILGFLPFETLIMPDGRYLCEKYIIRYNYSLTVSEMITGRDYPSTRKNLLAIGGAVYKSDTYAKDMINTDYELLAMQKQYKNDRGNKKSNFYQKLGYSSWNNLPGTLDEVKKIANVIDKSTLLTGKQASESNIKSLSKSGELSNYKILHFATHGIVVPEIPELSAIVLSQETDSTEDGYLRMDEIINLNIRADFINLSACETGLGKIYGGEGVVGLTQAFLLAGARGLSVSLWQVNDISTKEFMIAIYKKVKNENISYYKAIHEVKQEFINGEFGEKYKSPYYWSPFVYYGE